MTGPWKPIAIGSCWRSLVNTNEHLKEGTLVIVTDFRDENVVAFETGSDKETTWTSDEERFRREFSEVTDVEQEFTSRLTAISGEMAGLTEESKGVGKSLESFQPAHLNVSEGAVTEQALVPVTQDLLAGKRQATKVRNDIARIQLGMKQNRAAAMEIARLQKRRLESIFEAQQAGLQAKLGNVQKLLGRVEEAISSINLYLGKDEEIVQIAKGKPAPPDTKITVRQLVLYADEECAISAEKGGIDAQNLPEFDAWLAKPENRQQVFPEAKGIVGFKPRRKPKTYTGDVWTNAQLNAQNKKTYFLICNGENLYRICTSLEVGDHLVPTENEFPDIFFHNEFDWSTRDYRKEPIYPGDERYMKALETEEGLRKHYLRIVLFLQGLLDRTAVLAPLPAPRLNLLNRSIHTDHLVFINDAEKLLTDGKPRFWDWLRSVNSKLDVGHRIMGAFSSWTGYEDGLGEYRINHGMGNSRLRPEQASFPKSLALHTIDGRENRYFIFHYEREDEIIYRGRWQESGPAKRRAACLIIPEDRFVLNFDAVTTEEIKYYLGNRTDRIDYQVLMPLLKRALQLKEEEQRQEEPFRDLLARQIVKEHGFSMKEAQTAVTTLVPWWKLKNRIHRALTSDDAKALRMIVAEAHRRRRRAGQHDQLSSVDTDIISLAQNRGQPVFIAHRDRREFVVLYPENAENIYVHEERWRYDEDDWILSAEKHWVIPENRRILGWRPIFQNDRWRNWKIDARANSYLTDAELAEVIRTGEPKARSEILNEEPSWHGDKRRKGIPRKRADLICITRSKSNTVSFWYLTHRATIPDLLLTGAWQEPIVEEVEVTWTKKARQVSVLSYIGGSHDHTFTRHFDDKANLRPWDKGTVLSEVREDVVQELAEEVAKHEEASGIRTKLSTVVESICRSEERAMSDRILAKKKAAFLLEYEHEELWEDHQKTIPQHELHPPCPRRLRSAAGYLIERRYLQEDMIPDLAQFEGLTFGKIFEMARELGWKWDAGGDDAGADDSEKDEVPLESKVQFLDWEKRDSEDESEDESEDDSDEATDEEFQDDPDDDGTDE